MRRNSHQIRRSSLRPEDSFNDCYRRFESVARWRAEVAGGYARTCYEAGTDFEARRRAREEFDALHDRLLRAEDRALQDLLRVRVTDAAARRKGF
jgi:hypothetical protein